MKKLFRPNITSTGRLLRGLIALALLLAGIFASDAHWTIRVIFFVSATFVAFEALRGWCALRACGVRTRF